MQRVQRRAGLFADDPARLRAAAEYLETLKQRWRDLSPAEMALFLLRHPTISDQSWTRETRLPREDRTDFIVVGADVRNLTFGGGRSRACEDRPTPIASGGPQRGRSI